MTTLPTGPGGADPAPEEEPRLPLPEPQEPQPAAEPPSTEPQEQPEQPKRPRRDRSAENRIAQLARRNSELAQELEETRRRVTQAEETGLKASEGHIKAALDGAKAELIRARAAGDLDAETAAFERVAELKAEQAHVARIQQRPQQEQPRQQQQPQLTPRTAQWMSENSWYNQHPSMTAVANAAHQDAIQSGMQPDTDGYWKHIDKRVRGAFPEEFAVEDEQPEAPFSNANARMQGVAQPAVRRASVQSTTNPRGPVHLTADEREMARRFNMTEQAYAARKQAGGVARVASRRAQ